MGCSNIHVFIHVDMYTDVFDDGSFFPKSIYVHVCTIYAQFIVNPMLFT